MIRGFLAVPLVLAASLAVAAPAVAATGGRTPSPHGSIGIRLVDVPVDAANDPRAREYIVDHLQPGATIRRRIELKNTTAASLRVQVYATGATIIGGSFVGDAGRTQDELSTWTTVADGAVVVPAGSTTTDVVTVTVPKDASAGERYAVVWAEVRGADSGAVQLVNRVGVRVYVAVGGTNPPTSFAIDSMTAARTPSGTPMVLAQVRNTGGRAVDLSGTLLLSESPGALTAGPYTAQLGTTLAPGQSEPVRIVVTDKLPNGPWNATIDLRSGLLDETYQARVTFPGQSGAAMSSAAHRITPVGLATSTTSTPVLDAVVIAVLSALLLATVTVSLVVARRRRPRAGSAGDSA